MKSKTCRSKPSLVRVAGGLLTAAIVPLSLLFAFTPSAQAADSTVYDGSSATQAAASCWEIKTLVPAAPSGVYWLRTPSLVIPMQFYCDQVTDGGGWVLIARGRSGWKENYEGYGTTEQVSAVVGGTAAFTPRQLSSAVVDGLLNDQRPDSLTDGVRLRRATNTTGTAYQEVRYKYTKQARWVWTFRSETPVGAFTIAGANGSGGQTGNFGTDQNQRRVYMQTAAAQNWTIGFSYGTSARGSSASDSYVWSASANAGNPKPFTQMFLRPRLLQSTLGNAAIPDTGSSARVQAPLAQTRALPTVWGVSGLANGSTSEMSTEVQSVTQSGNNVYTGGNFKYIQQSRTGAGQVQQSYLAAFNVDSGNWVSTFRPTFNGQVKALATLPNGLVVAGGEFTVANGAPHAGIVVLNPGDGSTNSSVNVNMRNALSSGVLQVRSLKVEAPWLYIGGNFTHLGGGTHPATTVYARGAARVSLSDGTPDDGWNPAFNGTVSEVEPSADGTRLYAAGYFTNTNNNPANKIAALQTTAGAAKVVPNWTMISSGSPDFQFTVSEGASRIWHGGSEHDLFGYSKIDFSRLSTHIAKYNGDFQTSEISNGTLYAGCHCNDFTYSGASFWPNLGTTWTVADKLGFVGAWNAETGTVEPEFNPVLDTRAGHGAWATFTDSNGILWIGGDFSNSVAQNGASQWSGGFVRFAARDSAAPPAPTGLVATSNGLSDSLTWQPSAESNVSYQILRNDRVIGAATSTSFSTAAFTGGRYFVRAVDAAGNYSASTAVATAPVVDNPPTLLVPDNAVWSYRFENSAPDTAWKNNGYDDSAWPTGPAPLGWVATGIATPLAVAGTKPLAVQYRKTFTVANPTTIASLGITAKADDGVVVYVNGVEAGRSNMPAGTIAWNSYASSAPLSENTAPVTFTVSGSVLVAGINTIAAQVNSNYRSTRDSSFSLSVMATEGTQPPAPAEPQPLVADNATWNYTFENAAPDPGWQSPGFDATKWSAGQSPLGWGHSSIATTLTAVGTKPLAVQYVHTFDLDNLATVEAVKITTRADDGIVLYVNGDEVTRHNLPSGTISWTTYATAAPSTPTAVANPVVLRIPVAAFNEGTNTIAAAVHSNYRSTLNSSFALSAVTVPVQAAP